MFSVEVIFNPLFYEKTSKSIYHDAIVTSLGWVMQDAETQCKMECPVVTGNLQRSHYTEVTDTTGKVLNSADYAGTVINGNEERSPNNYPQRALNNMKDSYDTRFKQELEKSGVLG